MLLRVVLSLVSFAAFRFVMYSDNPDLVELRKQLYVAVLDHVAANKVAPVPEQTELQKLHARVEAETTPCAEDTCRQEGTPADQTSTDPASTAGGKSSFNPKFISVAPKK